MDTKEIKDMLAGRWAEVIASLSSVPSSILDGGHHPCPKCGGTDRFNLDRDGSGSAFCNNCGSNENNCVASGGINTIMWLNSWDFKRAIGELERYLGPGKTIKPLSDETLAIRNEAYQKLAKAFPITDTHREQLQYRGLSNREIDQRGYWSLTEAFSSIDMIRLWPQKVDRDPIAANVPGVLPGGALKIAAGAGLMIPVRDYLGNIVGVQCRPDKPLKKGGKYYWLSSKKQGVVPGSPCHHASTITTSGNAVKPGVIRITEGPLKADIATSLSGIKTIAIAGVSNWRAAADEIEKAKPLSVLMAFDADCKTNKWVAAAAVDLFDHLTTSGFSVQLEQWDEQYKGIDDALAAKSPVEVLDKDATSEQIEHMRIVANGTNNSRKPGESYTDPSRIARLNLEAYDAEHGGRLVYWNGSFYRYKSGRYRLCCNDDMTLKIFAFTDQLFDADWKERQSIGGDAEAEKPKKSVTESLVRNVLKAMAAKVRISSDTQLNTWLPDDSQRHYLAVENGIINLDEINNDSPATLTDHTPDWFSMVMLPTRYDITAEPVKWLEYLDGAMEGDQERIAILQEFAGYLLIRENPFQKFLALEGEGGNGKTVFTAGITAMLGVENVSNVPLQKFENDFSLAATVGKLANIDADVQITDAAAEGTLKSYTGGDRLYINPKYGKPYSIHPTAKLLFAWNRRPRMRDKSAGLWRRMLLVPFNRTVPAAERVYGMDQPTWWHEHGETPGILNWAIAGLCRLKENQRFTESLLSAAALHEYASDANPILHFLDDEIVQTDEPEDSIESQILFDCYLRWCKANKHAEMSSTAFFRELKKKFPQTQKKRKGSGVDRHWAYSNLKFSETANLSTRGYF